MGVSGDASVLLARYKQRTKAARTFVGVSEKETARQTMAAAVRLSTGPLTYSMLRKLGYPYARVANLSNVNPDIINVHDGSVAGGWSIDTFGTSAVSLTLVVKNSSPWMVFLLGGTDKMVPRRIDQAIIREVGRSRFERLRRNKTKALD